MKKAKREFARNGLVCRSSDEEIKRSVWHFSAFIVEGNKGGQDTPPQSLY
jgi:hypothetical protein